MTKSGDKLGPKGKPDSSSNSHFESAEHVSDEETVKTPVTVKARKRSAKEKDTQEESQKKKPLREKRVHDKQVVGKGKIEENPPPPTETDTDEDRGTDVRERKSPSRSPSPERQVKGKDTPASVSERKDDKRGKKGKSASPTPEESKKQEESSDKKRRKSKSPEREVNISKKNRKSLPLTSNTNSKDNTTNSNSDEESQGEEEEEERSSSPKTSSDEEEDSQSSSSSEEEKPKKKKKKSKKKKRKLAESRKRMKSLRKLNNEIFKKESLKEKYEFSLTKDLAVWANENITNFRSDKEIDEDILLKNQVPINIKTTPKVDQFVQSILTERHRKDHVFDGSLARLSKKITDIFGPLSKVWEAIEAVTDGIVTLQELEMKNVTKYLRLTVLLTGQAINAITFHRRRTLLRALIEDDEKAGTMLRKNYSEELKDNGDLLFGDEFKRKVTKDAKEEKKTLKEFLASSKKKPFRKPSSQRKPEGERRRAKDHVEKREREREFTDRDGVEESSFRGRGKIPKNLLQHALRPILVKPKMVENNRNPSSCDQSIPQEEISELPASGKTEILHKKLGKVNRGPRDIEYNIGMGNSVHGETISDNEIPTISVEQFPVSSNNRGGREHAGEGSNKESPFPPRSGSKQQHLSEGKEGGEFQAHHRSEEGERVHPISEIQDGNSEKHTEFIKRRGSDGQNRPQGCLLHCTPSREISEIHEVHVGREHLRVPMHDVRAGTSTQDIHEDHESSHEPSEKTENPDYHIHGRHAADGSGLGGNLSSQRHHNPPARISRISDKLSEINPRPINPNRISGCDGEQRSHVPEYSEQKIGETHGTMHENSRETHLDHEKTSKSAGYPESNSIRVLMGAPTDQISPTNSGRGLTKGFVIRIPSVAIRNGNMGTDMVAKQHGIVEWESPVSKPPGPLHLDRCSERGERGLGSRMPGDPYGRPLEELREKPQHQCPGAHSSRAGTEIFYQREVQHICPPEDGQHLSSELCDKDGRDEEPRYDQNNKENLDISFEQQDRHNCGIHPIQTEYRGGLGVSELERHQRVATESTDLPQNLFDLGTPQHGSVCLQGVSPNSNLYELETGPSELWNRCPIPRLDRDVPLCLSPILFNRQSAEEGSETQNRNDHNNPHMDYPTLVSHTVGNDHSRTPHLTQRDQHFERPSGKVSSSNQEQHYEDGSMAGLREHSGTAEVSETASMLIKNSRSSGTRRNYESAWNQFSSWCIKQEIDPVYCSLEKILSFLGSLFDRKLEYGSIGNYRSAISAYHAPIEGFKVGSHPLVSALMKGVSNERPTQPKYRYIWDVERVLVTCRNLPENKDLSLKQLSYKVVTLLGLCNINRGAELHSLI